WRTYVNLSVTMVLGGLWHGASWTFVVWGGLHGFGLAITRFFQRAKAARSIVAWCAAIAIAGVCGLVFMPMATWTALGFGWLAVALVFHYVCLAWIFFRASSFDNALAVLRQLVGFETDHANLVPIVMIPLAIGFLCHFFADGSFGWLRDRFVALPAWAQGLAL